jgi:hypothetical protein
MTDPARTGKTVNEEGERKKWCVVRWLTHLCARRCLEKIRKWNFEAVK